MPQFTETIAAAAPSSSSVRRCAIRVQKPRRTVTATSTTEITNDQTMRCARISIEPARASSGQNKGTMPQSPYAAIP